MSAAAPGGVVIPFTGAAHAYRRRIHTTTWTPGAANTDLSPPGGKVRSYGYMRALELLVKSTVTGTGGNVHAIEGDFALFSAGLQVTQPGGQEMTGGPLWRGWHAYLAAKQAGWKYITDPKLLPSYVSSATAPKFNLPIIFELNAQDGLGSIPNENDASPWQLQITAATTTQAYQTAPTTAPTLQLDVYLMAWTVPTARNPLNPNIQQMTQPPLLGTLNKWTRQSVVVPGGSAFALPLQRKGNSVRQLGFITYDTNPTAITALTNFPTPYSFTWDGTLIRSDDNPILVIDDEYMVRGGGGQTTFEPLDTGVIFFKMSDPAGIDISGVANDAGMSRQWGTVQTSALEVSGTWGATVASVEILTNDVQYVLPAANPYVATGSGPQYAAQPSALGR